MRYCPRYRWLRFLVLELGYAWSSVRIIPTELKGAVWSSVRIIPTTPKRNCLKYRWLRFFVLELGIRVVVRTDHPDRIKGGPCGRPYGSSRPSLRGPCGRPYGSSRQRQNGVA